MIEKVLEKEKNIVFDADSHKYYIHDIEHQSVTKLIKNYFPFDRQEISLEVAQRSGISQKEVLANWNDIMENGSYVHDLIDKHLRGVKISEDAFEKIKPVIDYLDIFDDFKVLASEVKIYSSKYKLAGTIDLIALIDGKLFLIDWKTNSKKIDKNISFEKALSPFDEFWNNNYYAYSLQLSLYSVILKEEYDIEVYDFFIVHIQGDTCTRVNVLDLRFEALELLQSL